MSSSRRARVEVGSPNSSLEFSLLNSHFQEVASGTGSLTARVDPGIYQLQVRAGPRVESSLLALEPGGVHRDLGVQLEYPSAAPLPGTTTSHEFQQQAVVEASTKLVGEPGPASGLVVVVRNGRGQESLPFDASIVKGFSLRDEGLRLVREFARGWKVERSEHWATWSGRLPPGGYCLRSTRPESTSGAAGATVDQALWLSPGWQTLVFVPNTVLGPDTDNASIHMTTTMAPWTPGWWDPNTEQSNTALELALWGLREGRPTVPDNLVDLLLHSKFQNPMLGIVGAYSLLLAPSVDFPRLDVVLANLGGIVPDHPDVAALGWLRAEAERTARGPAGYPQIAVAWPPMLCAGYSGLIRNDARTTGGILPGTTAEAIAPNLLTQSVWTSWLPLPGTVRSTSPRRRAGPGGGGGRKSALPPEPPRSRSRSAAKPQPDPATARVERYLDEVARLSTASTPAEALTQTSREQISVATSLPVGSVDRAIDELSSSWT